VPSKSAKQAKFMRAIAHSPEFAKKAGVPQSVGKEFVSADKGKKFNQGGEMKSKLFKGKETVSEELKEAKAIKSGKISPMQYAKGEESEKKMKKGGSCYAKGGSATEKPKTKCMAKGGLTSGRGDGIASKGKTKCKYV
jgi:hypothetical protein